jgi:hypothetical protein
MSHHLPVYESHLPRLRSAIHSRCTWPAASIAKPHGRRTSHFAAIFEAQANLNSELNIEIRVEDSAIQARKRQDAKVLLLGERLHHGSCKWFTPGSVSDAQAKGQHVLGC